ncbi:MAG: EAL domain-containing protein [Betaproteobacteria bacterium]|nr:EAL domain-containing protein [Betaproteobacteria bacterium]
MPLAASRAYLPGHVWQLSLVAGFAVQLLLILFVTLTGLDQLDATERHMQNVTEESMRKLELSKTMGFLARERTMNLFMVMHTADPFERDAIYLHFEQLANKFVGVRREFLKLPLTPTEHRLLEEQRRLSRIAVPYQEEAIALAMAGNKAGAGAILLDQAIPAQNAVLETLAELDGATHQSTQEAIREARSAHDSARLQMYALSGMALLIGIVVAVVVVRLIGRAGREREHMATHDALTGLPNRLLLMGRLEQAIARAQRQNLMIGVMFIDLDRFKLVNDTLGHAAGDELIRQVAARLSRIVRSDDIVARLGGDEFIVVVSDADKVGQIIHVVDKVVESIGQPYRIGDREFFTSASIGIGIYPHDGADTDDLLKNADTAMYHAKELGRNRYQLFDTEMNIKVAQRLELETDMRYGIERGEFRPYYQPQINLSTHRIQVVEVLMRWQHPTRGTLLPAIYLDLLEDTGCIVEVGRKLLREACRQCVSWQAAGQAGLAIAVNLSSKEFWQEDLCQTVAATLAETTLSPQSLHFELTESILMLDIDQAVDKIKELKRIGVRLAVDDFGTGYSSLAHLKHFPVDTLKIDRYFVKDIDRQSTDAAITQAILALSESLGLETVIEGVESMAQLNILHDIGCDIVQGFLFSEPVPGEAMSALFERDWAAEIAQDRPAGTA